MKQRFFLFVSVFALLIGVLVFSGTGSQAVAQQRPPGGDTIPVQPPSTPDPGNQSSGVEVVCSFSQYFKCGVKCNGCGQKYYSIETMFGYASNHRGKCKYCNSTAFTAITIDV